MADEYSLATADLLARIRGAESAGEWARAEGLLSRAAAAGSPFWRVCLADLLCRRGRPAEALALADLVLAEHPGHAGALAARGAALFRLGRAEAAATALEAAWGARPTPSLAWLLTRVRRRTGGAEAALQWVDRALRTHPDDVRLLRERAVLLLRLGRDADAAATAGRALELAPGDGRVLATWAAARIRPLAPGAAAEELRRLLQIPRLAAVPRLWALRARTLERAGRPEEAVHAWRAAAVAAPDDPAARAGLVFALRRCGRRAEAFDGLAALVRADPADTVALSAFVFDARTLDRRAVARRVLLDLLRRDPGRRHLWGWVRRLGAASGPVPPGARAGPAAGVASKTGPGGGRRPAAPPDTAAAPARGPRRRGGKAK